MESGKIKTALEIALERAERLGAASTDELRRQEEERHQLIGQGLAERYLAGLPQREVEAQLSRYSGAVSVRRSFLEALADAIGSADAATAEILFRAILYFAPSEAVRCLATEIEQMQRLYLSTKMSDLLACREEIVADAGRLYETMGIAGSAMRANVEAQAAWLSAQADLEAAHEERLTPLRQRLKSAIAGLS